MSLWRRAPLRFKLVASLVGLAALGLIVSGAVGARLLRGYLLDRVDVQLQAAAQSLASGPLSEEQAVAELPSPFHVSVYTPDGSQFGVLWTPLEDRRTSPAVPDRLTPDETQSRAGTPFTVDDVVGRGSWRAVAQPIEWPGGGVGTVLVATNLGEVDATVQRLQHIAMLVGLAVLAGLAIAGWAIVRAALRPLTEIEGTAAAITRGDLTRRVPDADPATEVGRVGRGLNTMLDQIEVAFEAQEASEATARRSEARMRQFVADASHELRTPLTSIRGFAELCRQPAMTEPSAVADALRRIEDEAKRMGLLVDDLLLLARLDQQRPFAADPVDLVTVARDAADAGRVVAQDHPITFAGPSPSSREPVMVSGDDVRLRQLATNLVDNAVRHTPPGTPIDVRVTVVPASADRNGDDGQARPDARSGEQPATRHRDHSDAASGADSDRAGTRDRDDAGTGERTDSAGDDGQARPDAGSGEQPATRHRDHSDAGSGADSDRAGTRDRDDDAGTGERTDSPGDEAGSGVPGPMHVGEGERLWAELTVADRGPGLTAEQASRVFERFYRTDTARSRRGPAGAGLGLSIVMAIAVAHGGTATVDTVPGEGATFRVRLPLLTAPPPAASTADTAAEQAATPVLTENT